MSKTYGLDLTGDIEKTYPKSEDFTNNGICSRCGNCCTNHLFITDLEKQQIKDYIKEHNIVPHHHTEQAKPDMAVIDLLCPFLDTSKNTRVCKIYPVRPAICQIYKCDKDVNDALFKEFDKALLKKGFDTKQISLKSIEECNTGQTFFPEEYTPKTGDVVIINELHMVEHLSHQNEIFIVTDQIRKKDNRTEVLLERANDRKTKIWFDIQGLTCVKFI